MKNVPDKVVGEIETHILYSVTVFRKLCRLRDNVEKVVQPHRPQTTIWLKRISRGVPNTHSEYVILIAFTLQQWLHERASVLHYTYIVSLNIITLYFERT
jgi:hypothetical protein